MSASRVPKKVFVVGGGWMGVYLAQALEKSSRANRKKNGGVHLFDVTIVDKKKSFYTTSVGFKLAWSPISSQR